MHEPKLHEILANFVLEFPGIQRKKQERASTHLVLILILVTTTGSFSRLCSRRPSPSPGYGGREAWAFRVRPLGEPGHVHGHRQPSDGAPSKSSGRSIRPTTFCIRALCSSAGRRTLGREALTGPLSKGLPKLLQAPLHPEDLKAWRPQSRHVNAGPSPRLHDYQYHLEVYHLEV